MLLNFDSAMSQWSVYLECLIIVWYLIGLKKDKILKKERNIGDRVRELRISIKNNFPFAGNS